jgi:hypothetical protein
MQLPSSPPSTPAPPLPPAAPPAAKITTDQAREQKPAAKADKKVEKADADMSSTTPK